MEKYLIIVEGKADSVFIKDYLYFLFSDNEKFNKSDTIGKFDKGKPNKIAIEPEIKILNAGSVNSLEYYQTQLKKHLKHDYFYFTKLKNSKKSC